jgi:lipopolysaccharide transport system permease protein
MSAVNNALQLHLIWQFTKRDLLARYQGSVLGLAWLLITPILMLILFTLVFHGIFGMKWPSAQTQSPIEFALFLFVGLSVFQFFADVINRSATLIISQPNLVTKVVFPLWVLPIAASLATSVSLMINIGLLLIAVTFMQGASWVWLWLPMMVLPLFIFMIGIAWLLAAIGVYLRDLSQILSMIVTALMFLSPIFYPLSAVPEAWQSWFMLNPLAVVIEQFRQVLILQLAPDMGSLVLMYLLAITIAIVGWFSFAKLQKGFADVL